MVNGGVFLGRNKFPRRGVTQYSGNIIILDGGDYWIPAFAGMTAVVCGAFSLHCDPASSPYDVLTVWMPHSVFGLPRQRPARVSSSGEVRLVQGMQPTQRKPFAVSGCGGRFAALKIASIASLETLANGLNFSPLPSSSTTPLSARRPPSNRLRPLIQALNRANARFSGSTLRIRQQASGSENHNSRSGSSRDSVSSEGLIERTSRKPSLAINVSR